MAALVEGRQYGLSSKGHLNENKTRILVKFTDSALKAVDEHLNSRSGSGKYPTIQFHGNQGCITFPSSNGEHSFRFGVSSTADIEGPQGSFECIQQCGSRSLDSLGSMQFKMHIQAKEDVYEVTRQKMAVAEEESKKNCTKIIKHTDSFVGRKVKKHAVTTKHIAPYSSSNNHLKNGSIYNSKSNGVNGYHNNNNGNFNKSLPSNPKPAFLGNSEIQKKSFRERIVHLLALRPFKLPEILARLMKDGLGDKDKQSLNSILSKVAVLKDNKFTMAKHTWNEIQEDWPFYTEFERQLIKRNRAQIVNVLPSSQSSGNDSPLNSQNGNSPNSLQKRQNVEAEPPSAKRPRISHYNHSSNGKQENYDGHGPNSREVLQNNHKPELNHVNGYSRTINDSTRNGSIIKSETNGYHIVNNRSEHHSLDILGDKDEINGHSDSFSQKTELNGWNSSNNHHLNSQNSNNHINNGTNNTNRHNNLSPTLSTLPHMTPLPSPDGQDSLELRGFLNETSNGCVVDVSYSDSEYLKKYTEILTPEQRARYKSDFNAEYLLYRDVHTIVDQVSKRFTVLKDNLRKVDEYSEDWQKVKDQILREYGEMKRDSKYQDARHKFQIMHEKLSHIKRLIFEYDQLNGIHS